MSGASGKIPAAIHLSPESRAGGPIARIRDGDEILLDAQRGILEVALEEQELQSRPAAAAPPEAQAYGFGRELFDGFRARVGDAEAGAMSLLAELPAAAKTGEKAVANEY